MQSISRAGTALIPGSQSDVGGQVRSLFGSALEKRCASRNYSTPSPWRSLRSLTSDDTWQLIETSSLLCCCGFCCWALARILIFLLLVLLLCCCGMNVWTQGEQQRRRGTCHTPSFPYNPFSPLTKSDKLVLNPRLLFPSLIRSAIFKSFNRSLLLKAQAVTPSLISTTLRNKYKPYYRHCSSHC